MSSLESKNSNWILCERYLFAALLIGALIRNPASLLGAGLSLVALAAVSWVLVGAVKSRFDGRG